MLGVRKVTPTILCTGYSEMVSAEKAQEVGVRAFVMKPAMRKELAETVRKGAGRDKGRSLSFRLRAPSGGNVCRKQKPPITHLQAKCATHVLRNHSVSLAIEAPLKPTEDTPVHLVSRLSLLEVFPREQASALVLARSEAVVRHMIQDAYTRLGARWRHHLS
jgi:DNA-binding NarL/FixJ family response regulator